MSVGRRTFLKGLGAGAVGAAVVRPVIAAVAQELPGFSANESASYWEAVRAQYPLLPEPAYLNTGGLGPAPRPVLDAVERVAARLQQHSETGHEGLAIARKAVADFIGADADEVCFVRNATEGNSIIASGLRLEPDDEVIFETHAHPGGSFPWLNQAKRRGVVVRLFEPDPTDPDANVGRIRELISPRTKVIQVSHITCTTGLVFPVESIAALARSKGVWFHVDGAQAAGMVPVDVRSLDCDSYAFSGHKWLGGPHETGVLYIRREKLDAVECSCVGAYSGEIDELPGEIRYVAAASRHEYGTRSASLIAGLNEAVRFQVRIGPSRIASRGRELAVQVLEGLSSVQGIEVLTPRLASMRASIVTFRHPRADAGTMFGFLMSKHRLRCRPAAEQGLKAIRVSAHIFNSSSECDRVISAARDSMSAL